MITNTMHDAMTRARDNGGRLVRVGAGYWTYAGCARSKRGVPDWWVSDGTVKSMMKERLVEVASPSQQSRWPEVKVVE